MVKIRLSRIGSRGQPYYRVVVVDERRKRDGAVLESIGRYNPRTEPSTFEIDQARLKYWRGVGAQLTEPVRVLLGETEPKKHQPKNVKSEVPATPVTAPTTPEATAALPEPTPSEGAATVATDAPETTPDPSPALAEAEIASAEASTTVTPEVSEQVIEKTDTAATSSVAEEKQPTSGETKADVAEEVAESDNPEEAA